MDVPQGRRRREGGGPARALPVGALACFFVVLVHWSVGWLGGWFEVWLCVSRRDSGLNGRVAHYDLGVGLRICHCQSTHQPHQSPNPSTTNPWTPTPQKPTNRWSTDNSYFQLSNPRDGLAMGGGGAFALLIDPELLNVGYCGGRGEGGRGGIGMRACIHLACECMYACTRGM